MATSVSDIAADAVVKTEYPPDIVGRNVGQDIGYIFKLLGLHLRRDPLLGSLLWILVLGLEVGSSYLGLQLALQVAAVTNGLVAHDRAAVTAALTAQFVVIGLYFAYQTLSIWMAYVLRIRIRTVLVDRLVCNWLGGRNLYDPSQKSQVDYPEQRVQEDSFNFAQYAIDIAPLLVGVAASSFLYSQQLWHMSKPMELYLPLGGEIVVPRALYVLAVISAIFVTVLSHLVGRVLTRVEVVRQRVEAGFRHDLAMAREFAEQIVLSKGEAVEATRAQHNYALIRKNWTPYTIFTALLTGIQASSAQLGAFLPWILLAPLVLAGELKVGDLALSSAAYLAVFTVFASGSRVYLSFAILRSAAVRLHLMDRSLSREPVQGIRRVAASAPGFELEDVEVRTATGLKLFSSGSLRISSGEKWLVRGRSGSGKSTLFRVLAGIWPFGSGTLRQPADQSAVMFLPQKPYLPNGSLAELLSYPRTAGTYPREKYKKALRDVCLGQLADRLDEVQPWSKILSGGEQQRICVARALLERPDFLFLDEATSSLDPETETIVFKAITEQLAHSAIVTIAHTDRMAAHHDHVLKIDDERATMVDLGAPRPKQDPEQKDGPAGEVDA